jgi:hypothetical protein
MLALKSWVNEPPINIKTTTTQAITKSTASHLGEYSKSTPNIVYLLLKDNNY